MRYLLLTTSLLKVAALTWRVTMQLRIESSGQPGTTQAAAGWIRPPGCANPNRRRGQSARGGPLLFALADAFKRGESARFRQPCPAGRRFANTLDAALGNAALGAYYRVVTTRGTFDEIRTP